MELSEMSEHGGSPPSLKEKAKAGSPSMAILAYSGASAWWRSLRATSVGPFQSVYKRRMARKQPLDEASLVTEFAHSMISCHFLRVF
jgi:hypothetical protein